MNSSEETAKVKKINIAIDGHSSCGKSTTSRLLAERLHYKYIDTGAMYRAVTLFLIRNAVDWNDKSALERALAKIRIDFLVKEGAKNRTLLNGEDVEDSIRTLAVSAKVSEVSAISPVRRKLVEQQQKIAGEKGIVMDGRDIGTVVLPDAELKVFMTATLEARAQRRYRELKEGGMRLSLEDVMANLKERDRIDSTRTDSPLKRAEDAILLDTSGITIEEQTEWLYEKAMEAING